MAAEIIFERTVGTAIVVQPTSSTTPSLEDETGAQWNGDLYRKRDVRVENLLKRRRCAGSKWRTAVDVANLAGGRGLPLDQEHLRNAVKLLVAATRLDQLSRNGRCGVLIAHHGAIPFRLNLQFIDEQTAIWGEDGFVDLFMDRAWLPEWAWQKYLQVVETHRISQSEPGWDLCEEGHPPMQVATKRAAKSIWPNGRPLHLKNPQVDEQIRLKLGTGPNLPSSKTIDRALGRKRSDPPV